VIPATATKWLHAISTIFIRSDSSSEEKRKCGPGVNTITFCLHRELGYKKQAICELPDCSDYRYEKLNQITI